MTRTAKSAKAAFAMTKAGKNFCGLSWKKIKLVTLYPVSQFKRYWKGAT